MNITLRNAETEIIISPLLKEIKNLTLEDSKRVQAVQEIVLKEILYAEYNMLSFKKTASNIKDFTRKSVKTYKQLKARQKANIDKVINAELLVTMNGISEWATSEYNEYKHRANVLRSIIDSIVWQFYRRDQIKILGMNPKMDLISNKTGLFHELDIFLNIKKHIKNPRITILNDLTNCLTIGDITVIDRKKSTKLIECKTKGRFLKKQDQKMNDIAKFLSSPNKAKKTSKWLSEQYAQLRPMVKTVHIATINGHKLKHRWKALEKVMQNAKVKGHATITPEEGLEYYVSYEPQKIKLNEKESKEFYKYLHKYRKTGPKIINDKLISNEFEELCKKAFDIESLDATENNGMKKRRKKSKGIFFLDVCQKERPYWVLPFPLFKIKEEFILDLLLDRAIFFVEINLNTLERMLNQKGIEMIKYEEGKGLCLKKEGHESIAFAVFLQVPLECLSLKSFVYMMDLLA
jgi:hypothetical protein